MLSDIDQAITNNGVVCTSYSQEVVGFFNSAFDFVKAALEDNPLFSLAIDKLEKEQHPIASLHNDGSGNLSYQYHLA